MPAISQDSVLITIPTYNEVDNVESLCELIFKNVPKVQVCFIDDNSQDGTRDKIRALQKRFPGQIHMIERPGKLGLGTAYITAFKWALARPFKAIIEMDADHSHNPADLTRMIDLLQSSDVVVGSRYVKGGGTQNWSPFRKLISRCGSIYGRAILGMPIRDFTGGFNGWQRRVLEALDLDGIRSEGYAFQIELKFRANQLGFKVTEMPIIFTERRAGKSKMSGNILVEAIWRVWQIRQTRVPRIG